MRVGREGKGTEDLPSGYGEGRRRRGEDKLSHILRLLRAPRLGLPRTKVLSTAFLNLPVFVRLTLT